MSKALFSARYTTWTVLLLAFILMAEIPLLTAFYAYYEYESRTVIENEKQYETQLVEGALDDYLRLYPLLEQIKYEVASQLHTLNLGGILPSRYSSDDLSNIRVIENQIQSIRRTAGSIVGIYVINAENRLVLHSTIGYYSKERLLEKEWVRKRYESFERWETVPSHYPDYYRLGKRDIRVASFFTGLADPDMDGLFEYIIQMDVSHQHINDILLRTVVDESDVVLVTNADGQIILENNYLANPDRAAADTYFSPLADRDAAEIIPEEGKLLISRHSPETGVSVYKLKDLANHVGGRLLRQRIAAVCLFSTLAAALISVLTAGFITWPIRRLIHSIDNTITDKTPLQPVKLRTRNRDISSLAQSYNILIERVNQLIQDLVRQERESRKIETRMLQAQINPHFLYNTLNSIKWMAFMKRETQIADSIVSLVNILEFSCKHIDELATIELELAFLMQYISLQRIRYSDKIKIDFDIDPAIRSLYIPKFTLQPAVENALLHGFDNTFADPGILVSGRLSDGAVVFTVVDNGKGFDVTGQKYLTGIGLKNVNDRIVFTFGPDYGQSVESAPGKGTKITIRLPAIDRPEGGSGDE